MIADSMVSLVKTVSVIRAMFGKAADLPVMPDRNVYDFSLGNPNVWHAELMKQLRI